MAVLAPASAGLSCLYSSLVRTDPDLADLVELFVAELPPRIAALRGAFATGDMPLVGTLAHQLKGAAGSHGFNDVTPLARRLEQAARSGEPPDLVRDALEDLAAICNRLRPGAPPNEGSPKH